ncbi:MAG: tetratricopeptide repeat protein [Candidatus Omnitrophota bacterium]|jgi:tetratricopeptide (TPR) repeat protein
MLTSTPKIDLKKIILNLVILFLSSNLFVFAQDLPNLDKKEELTALQQQAREYRDEGIKMQDMGDLDSAMKLYQKAIEVDSAYAVVYNDLGVIYEAKDMIGRAEESYIKAIKIDPYYLSTYTNLALLYEGRREFGKAAYCWKKRAELGDLEDPWTKKARERLEDIRLSLSPRPAQDSQEKDVVKLMKDVANEKYMLRHDDKFLAHKNFIKANDSFNKEDYATAVKKASDAQVLDPDNKAIEEFIERSQNRALSR